MRCEHSPGHPDVPGARSSRSGFIETTGLAAYGLKRGMAVVPARFARLLLAARGSTLVRPAGALS